MQLMLPGGSVIDGGGLLCTDVFDARVVPNTGISPVWAALPVQVSAPAGGVKDLGDANRVDGRVARFAPNPVASLQASAALPLQVRASCFDCASNS